MPKILILDYGLGNLRSVEKALEKVGGFPKIGNDIGDLKEVAGIILPGVGAFRDAQLRLSKISSALMEQVDSGKPLLGICLGLQLLFTESTEGGLYKGLDVISGKVIRFPGGLKVPQMGWNTITILGGDNPLVEGVDSGSFVYFVHSYYAEARDRGDIVAETDYGVTFPSIVSRKNVYATQFHPEKSGAVGLGMLKNFVQIVKK